MKKNLIIILLLVLSCFSIFLSPFLSKGVIIKAPAKDSVCILNVMSEEGLNVPIQLFEGGYVSGALPFCYQRIDEALFNEFIEFLKAQETIKQP